MPGAPPAATSPGGGTAARCPPRRLEEMEGVLLKVPMPRSRRQRVAAVGEVAMAIDLRLSRPDAGPAGAERR